MNYRHSYHAGNFADVLKHVTLLALTLCLQRKATPFCYLDTHAGAGCYDLLSPSQKNQEYHHGIGRLIAAKNPPALIQRYLDCATNLHAYPGSPFLVRKLLRPQDRIIATELHPEEHRALKNLFLHDTQVAVHAMDGYLGLKAFLPPKERRGFVLIDPPYENPQEYTQALEHLAIGLKRWETGIFALWYPIKDKAMLARFYQKAQEMIKTAISVIELSIYPNDVSSRLNGCGILMVQPPWGLLQSIQEIMPWLTQTLCPDQQGSWRISAKI